MTDKTPEEIAHEIVEKSLIIKQNVFIPVTVVSDVLSVRISEAITKERQAVEELEAKLKIAVEYLEWTKRKITELYSKEMGDAPYVTLWHEARNQISEYCDKALAEIGRGGEK